MKTLAHTSAVCLALALTSCFSSSRVNSKNEVSAGRQLTELDDARRQGLVSDNEYLRLKRAIIKKNS